MAFHKLIDGALRVLGNVTVSSLTVSNGLTVPIAGAVTFSATAFTLTASSTSSANISAVTQNVRAGKLTTTALTTLSNTTFQLVVTNSVVSTTDLIFWSISNGTNTAASNPLMGANTVVNGAVTFRANTMSGAALNGTLIFDYVIFK